MGGATFASPTTNNDTAMNALLNLLLTSHNINGNARKNVEALLTGTAKVRTCHTSGSGRFTSNIDSHAATVDALNKLGLKFTQGNDAPKGGKTGQWISLNDKKAKDITKLFNA